MREFSSRHSANSVSAPPRVRRQTPGPPLLSKWRGYEPCVALRGTGLMAYPYRLGKKYAQHPTLLFEAILAS